MRLPRILGRYIAREVALYGIVGFLAFSLVLVSANVARRVELLAAANFSSSAVLEVLGCLFAIFAAPAVPMAFLFGILLGVGRLSGDGEILALQANGLGPRTLLVPILLLALAITAGSAYLMLHVEPAAHRKLRNVKVRVATHGLSIEPGRFYRPFGDRVLFAREADGSRLRGVLVSDRSDPERPLLIFAEACSLSFDAESAQVHLLFQSGEIHLQPRDADEERYRRWTFRTFDYAIDVSEELDVRGQLKPRDMTLAELRDAIRRADRGEYLSDLRVQDPVDYRLQLHRRFALPLAPVVFALVGVPLALRRGRGVRAAGALISVVLIFGYYVLMTVGEGLAERGLIPAALALWLPNLGFAAASIPLLRGMARRSL